jgi:hypothetical protein
MNIGRFFFQVYIFIILFGLLTLSSFSVLTNEFEKTDISKINDFYLISQTIHDRKKFISRSFSNFICYFC